MTRQITMERTWQASIEDVWELWTTKEGIEAWWGPDGFRVTVTKLELWVGGALEYVMTAFGPDQVAFMKQSGQPLSQLLKARYTAVELQRLAAWMNRVDFAPDVEPYEVETRVELEATPQGVHMVLRFDVMHDERWTHLATMGWESELGKLAKALEQRRKRS